jgi:hypothetical protein
MVFDSAPMFELAVVNIASTVHPLVVAFVTAFHDELGSVVK